MSTAYQPMSGKAINKMNINSVYGATQSNFWQPNQIHISTPRGSGKSYYHQGLLYAYAQTLNGFNIESKGMHAINHEYPFEYEKLSIENESSYEEYINMDLSCTRFERRLNAEIFRLNKLISYYRNVKNNLKPEKAKFRNGRQVHRKGKFNGYPNEALRKVQLEQERARYDEIIADYKFQLENIEEEHPEWLI